MNTLDMLRNMPLVDSVGWTLVHFLWQGLLIAFVLRTILQILGPNDANKRYIAATCAMIALTVAPFIRVSTNFSEITI